MNESTESGDMAHTAMHCEFLRYGNKKSRREMLMNLVNERIAGISPIALLYYGRLPARFNKNRAAA